MFVGVRAIADVLSMYIRLSSSERLGDADNDARANVVSRACRLCLLRLAAAATVFQMESRSVIVLATRDKGNVGYINKCDMIKR